MVLIFVVSSMSAPPSLPAGISDKVVHALAYAALGALMLRALVGARWHDVRAGIALTALAIALLYGVTDEWHQRYVAERMSDPLDLAADAVGATAGVGVAWAWGIVLSSMRQPASAGRARKKEVRRR